MTATSIGFSTPKRFNPVSWLVRKFTKAKCSHTFFIYHDVDFDRDMVMEAHELGFRLLSLRRFRLKNNIIGVFTPPSLDAGLKWASDFLGTGYDFGGLVGTLWVLAGERLKRVWKNPLQNPHAMFCSEIMTFALQKSDCKEFYGLVPSRTTPQNLLQGMPEQWRTQLAA